MNLKEEIKNKIDCIEIDENTTLIIKVNGEIEEEGVQKLRDKIKEETGCKCLIFNNKVELLSILNHPKEIQLKENEKETDFVMREEEIVEPITQQIRS